MSISDNPLQDPSYLLSTIEIIAESFHERSSVSIHNLLDAYATFANRLRSHSQLLEACDTLLPVLVPLSIHKDNFIRALRRDVHLAHVDPFSTLSRPSSLDDTGIHLNITADTKQYARDSSSLCHHALCAVTTILRFPAFYFAFLEHDLSSLFDDIVDIALSNKLPVLNEVKTYSLSLWALGCHHLLLHIFWSRQDDIFSALQRSLDSTDQPDSIIIDGLKAVSHTIGRHPSAFLDLLAPLLPHVIANLSCKSPERHLQASITLGKFADALIHQTGLSLTKWQSLSNYITSFLESRCDESQITPGDTSFLCMVRAAFSAESYAHHTTAPARVLAVLASLIILCGPTLYKKPTVLHIILQSLAIALTHKRSIVRALHPHVWRCFIWTFSQMFLNPESVEPASISFAFHVIKQEVSGGVGVALVSTLLSGRISATRPVERGERVSQALSVIQSMAQTECKYTRNEAFMFLQALTNNVQVRHRVLQNTYEIPAGVLLNGVIIGADWDNLPSVIHSIPKVPVSVQWPEETEIGQHYKSLLVTWKHFAGKSDRKHLDSSLVDVWLSILLTCSHQLEYGQHITTTSEILRYAAAIIVEFLPSAALEDRQPDWGSWNIQDQLCSLTFIDQLWSAMQRAFITLNLAEVAVLILSSILKLCASLMTTAPPSFLRDTHDLTTSQLVIRSQRELWGVVATSLSSSDLSLDWKELVKFLAIPIGTWTLSGPELEAWKAILWNAIDVSGNFAIVIEHIVSQYLRGKDVETWDSTIAVLGFLLTCSCKYGSLPTDELLSVADVCLAVCYGRARDSPDVLEYSLKFLNITRDVIVSAPDNVMRILLALRSSLCLWIEDHTEAMSDDEFNSVAVSLYCEALKALEVLPLSAQSLQDTEYFLASAFSRIPMPAIAPFAFEKFWKATYHGQAQFCDHLPAMIKSCLSCFVAAYGGDLADGLSLTTGSQSQSISSGSQVYPPTSHPCRDPGRISLQISPSPKSIHAEARVNMEDAPKDVFAGQDHTVILAPSPGDHALPPTALSQLQEYTSQISSSFQDSSERSTSTPQVLLSPIMSPRSVMLKSCSPEETHTVTLHLPNQERKPADDGNVVRYDVPQKHSRISRDILYSVRKLESELATRDVTLVDVPHVHSVPSKRKRTFDGIEVPTLREISHRRMVQRAKDTIHTGQDRVSVPPTPSSRSSARRKSWTLQPALPSSDDDDLDWENLRVDGTSSEVDVDRSLMGVQPSSPLLTGFSVSHGSNILPSGSSPPRAMSQSQTFPIAPPRPSIQRAKTTLSRLDTLRDVYSSVATGASQIPLPELMQATRLVHQIGAVLMEQMDKKLEKKLDDPR